MIAAHVAVPGLDGGSFYDWQQVALYSFARDVGAGLPPLPGHLVQFVDEDNPVVLHTVERLADHILFLAAGAFHVSKVGDLIPELQGRFPIRVELQPLTQADFVRIMTEPENALTKQYQALCASDGANLEFTDDGVEEIARIATLVNDRLENIGARRLHTVMTSLLDEVLFELPGLPEKHIVFDASRVRDTLMKIVEDEDLRNYIL